MHESSHPAVSSRICATFLCSLSPSKQHRLSMDVVIDLQCWQLHLQKLKYNSLIPLDNKVLVAVLLNTRTVLFQKERLVSFKLIYRFCQHNVFKIRCTVGGETLLNKVWTYVPHYRLVYIHITQTLD